MVRLRTAGKSAGQELPWALAHGLFLVACAVFLTSCDNFGGLMEWPTYTIVYHANDGSGRSQRFSVSYGTAHAIEGNIFEHDDIFFQGWKSPCKARTFGGGYTAHRLATNAGQIISLYAIWDGRIAVFRPNGGSGSVPLPVIGIEDVTLPDAPGLSKAGHGFVGWARTPYHLEASYMVGGLLLLDTDISFLYAVWIQDTYVFTVDFNANGGGGVGPPRIVVNIGGYIWLPLQYGLHKDGYVFVGWGYTPNAVNYGSGARFEPTNDVVLYAIWAPIFTVSFGANGGSGTGPESIMGGMGSNIRLPYRNGLIRTGYVFVGWSTVPGGPGDGFLLPGQIFEPPGNITLHAVWRTADSVDFFIVTFHDNNGFGTVPPTRVAISNIGIMLPGGVPLPGHVFVGWSRVQDATEAEYLAHTMFTPNGDVTLFAVWGEADLDTGTGVFTISFADFFNIDTESIGPTVRIIGTPEETTGRITVVNPEQYDPYSIRWFLEGVEITNPDVIDGGMRETIILDSRLHNDRIRTHRVTVSVRKAGVPFSKVIVFTVVP